MSRPALNAYRPGRITAPGETVADLLEERQLSVAELAAAFGLPETEAIALLNGSLPLTLALAERLDATFGVALGYWLRHERAYREQSSSHAEVGETGG